MCVEEVAMMKISDNIKYIGVDDTDIDLFESQYVVPEGMSYNSYLLKDDKTVLFDTVDKSCASQFYENLELGYFVFQHLIIKYFSLLPPILLYQFVN